ncbi:MAG: hypothetical protein NXY57DRAFT_967203 [Lentinula lateritia]|nr:MAG: hypothetical protein NXY57DRAFT_967203 [Lentinula lateritia]
MVSHHKRKGTGGSNSRRLQQYGGGSATALDFMKNQLKTVRQTEITKLKAQQDQLRSNEQDWEEVQSWDVEGGAGCLGGHADEDDEDDLSRVQDVLHGKAVVDHSHAGDWQDITASFWQTDGGKSQVEPMANAYMVWYAGLSQSGLGGEVIQEYNGDLNA